MRVVTLLVGEEWSPGGILCLIKCSNMLDIVTYNNKFNSWSDQEVFGS